MLRPRGEHAVRFIHALRDKVVDKNAYVGLVSSQDERRFAPRVKAALTPAIRPWAAASS